MTGRVAITKVDTQNLFPSLVFRRKILNLYAEPQKTRCIYKIGKYFSFPLYLKKFFFT